MEYKGRLYQCPICEASDLIGTNHIGQIYTKCRHCRNTKGLNCIEKETINALKDVPMGKVRLMSYQLDLTKDKDKETYNRIKVKTKGIKLYKELVSIPINSIFTSWLKKKNKRLFSIINPDKFGTQFISVNGPRLHLWYEYEVPNNKIKIGYYLTDIDFK